MIADQSTVVERLFLCGQCEHKKGSGFMARCNLCGCFIEAKTRLASQSCPDGRWNGTQAQTAPTEKPTKQFAKCCGSK